MRARTDTAGLLNQRSEPRTVPPRTVPVGFGSPAREVDESENAEWKRHESVIGSPPDLPLRQTVHSAEHEPGRVHAISSTSSSWPSTRSGFTPPSPLKTRASPTPMASHRPPSLGAASGGSP